MNQQFHRRSIGWISALEPRLMFDGAVAATEAAVTDTSAAAAAIAAATAPTVVREADTSKTGGKLEVVFVDTSVSDYLTLEASIADGVAIVEISGGQSGLAQIAQWAESHSGYSSLTILSHGADGTLSLGADVLTTASLSNETVAAELAIIGRALTDDGDILLYGCDIAESATGQALIDGLAAATGADVAASTDTTGISGDWTLEYAHGTIDTADVLTGAVATYIHDLSWAANPGGQDSDTATSIATDSSGNVYVTGSFSGSMTVGSTTLTAQGGGTETFLIKYDSSGDVVWAKSFGVTGYSGTAYSVAADLSGNVYVTGYFSVGSMTVDSFTLTSHGSYDVFLIKYDSSGTVQWATNFGSSSSDMGMSVTTDSSGNVYVTGQFQNSMTVGSTNLTGNGGYDAFLIKYSSSGNVLWATSFGGTSSDQAQSVTVDSSGNVYLTGYYYSSSISIGSTTLTNQGSTDSFLVKYDSSGNVLWATNIGGSAYDGATAVATDSSGNVYVGGTFLGSMVVGTTTLTSNGAGDAFLIKYDSSGNVVWATSFGGSSDDTGRSIAVDSSGNVYITGYFQNSMSVGTTTLTSKGNQDAFLIKYDSSGNVVAATSFGGTGADISLSVAIDRSDTVYVAGYFVSPSIKIGSTTLTNHSNVYSDVFVGVPHFSTEVAPTLTATGGSPTYTEGDGSAVALFSSTAVTLGGSDTDQSITGLTLTVSNVRNSSSESLVINGTKIALTNGTSVTANGITYAVTLSGTTATITISGTLTTDAAAALVDTIAYQNSSSNPTAGTRTVTLTGITDSGDDVNSTILSIAATVTVEAVNDAPTVTVPGAQTMAAGATLVITGVSIADVDAGSGSVTVTVTATNGTLSVSGSGATISGDGTSSLTITGSLANVNTVLASLTYTTGLAGAGGDTITVSVDDGGNSGSGGAKSANRTIAVTIPGAASSSEVNTIVPRVVVANDSPAAPRTAPVSAAAPLMTVVRGETGAATLASLFGTATNTVGRDSGQDGGATLRSDTLQVARLVGEVVSDGASLNFQLPVDAFTVAVGTDRVALTATSPDGKPLPTWLSFDPRTGRFTGTPPAGERMVEVRVTVRDRAGNQASQVIRIRFEAKSAPVADLGHGRASLSAQLAAAHQDRSAAIPWIASARRI